MSAIGVIPARYASTRFPGKPLCPILGKPMIQWVCERASRARGLDAVLVATDDERIERAVRSFGGEVVMTPSSCASGSDRVWLAVRDRPADIVLNIQGDEPTLRTECLETLLDLMASEPGTPLGTLAAPVASEAEYLNPNVVKVVLGRGGRCLYFSRSPVPHLRGRELGRAPVYKHVGIYAFRKAFLQAFTSWPPGELESSEALEQLRALERGVDVRAAVVSWPGCGVDEPGDVAAAETVLRDEAPNRPEDGLGERGGGR
jgi:3-deoxy-manno-octulosonate cytidylyltransferase (CMP-KDO synthetase)